VRATSQASLDAASDRWEPVLREAGVVGVTYGEQLYGLADLLSGDVTLCRALTDPSRSPEDKAGLAARIVRGRVADDVADLVVGLARSRWSAPADFAEALETLAVDSVLAAAQARGVLEGVEDELFRFDRILTGQRDLRLALANQDLPLERRLGLVDRLLGQRVQPETLLFVRRAVTAPRASGIFSTLNGIGERAAERRSRLVATVIAAAPLTRAQVDRLRGILERAYGQPVQVNVGVDNRLIGGLRVTMGPELVDASVLARLDEVRRRLAG
jgi:F-type H+-transporting ATPase subunit delta